MKRRELTADPVRDAGDAGLAPEPASASTASGADGLDGWESAVEEVEADVDARASPPAGAIGAPLDALLRALEAAATPAGAEPHVQAFNAWIAGSEESSRSLRTLAEEAARLSGAARTYRHVAVLGFAADLDGVHTPAKDAQAGRAAALNEGLAWLSGREWFAPGRVPTFEADPVALLGVARGIAAVTSTAHGSEDGGLVSRPGRVAEGGGLDLAGLASWADTLLARSATVLIEPWEQGLVAAARHAIVPTAESTRRIVEATPDLAVALAATGRIDLGTETLGIEQSAMAVIGALSYRSAGADRAAAQSAALRWLVRSAAVARPDQATVADVVTLLQGVERSLRRWTWEEKPSTRGATLVRWPVVNEYHVQNLLWALLASVFSDLEDEEQLPSFGPKHPRYDLGIPALQLIVEVKFVRGGSSRDFADVVEQVAADASLYLSERSRYRHLIAFVWDDSRHTEQYGELRQGLLKLPGVVGAVVIARPGRMGKPEGRRAVGPAEPRDVGASAPKRRGRRS